MSTGNGKRLPGPMALALGQLGAALDDVRGTVGDGSDNTTPSDRGAVADHGADPVAGAPKGGPLAALNQRVEQLQQVVDASREEARRRARLTLRLTAIQWLFFVATLVVTNWDTIGPWVSDTFARAVHGWGIQKFVEVEQQNQQSRTQLAAAEAELARAHKELEADSQDPVKQAAVADAAIRVRNLRNEVEASQKSLDEYRKRYRK